MIWALHGAAGSAGNWDPLRVKGMNLRAVSLWGQVAEYGVWAKVFCECVRREDPAPSVLGYSMGGRLALHALLDDPGMWRSGIIVSAHPGLEDEDEDEKRAREGADALWARRFREDDLERVLRDWDSRPVLAGTGMDRDVAEAAQWRMAIADSLEVWGLGRQAALCERLEAVTCPVLWVTGARDEKYTALAKRAVSYLPNGEHVVVEDCGHRVPWEETDMFAKVVIGFQNRVAMGAG